MEDNNKENHFGSAMQPKTKKSFVPMMRHKIMDMNKPKTKKAIL